MWLLKLLLTHCSRIRALSSDTTCVMERPGSVAPIERQIGVENRKFYCVRFPGILSLKWALRADVVIVSGGAAWEPGGLWPPVRLHKVKETAERSHTPASFVSSCSSLTYNYTRFLVFAVCSPVFFFFFLRSSHLWH